MKERICIKGSRVEECEDRCIQKKLRARVHEKRMTDAVLSIRANFSPVIPNSLSGDEDEDIRSPSIRYRISKHVLVTNMVRAERREALSYLAAIEVREEGGRDMRVGQ